MSKSTDPAPLQQELKQAVDRLTSASSTIRNATNDVKNSIRANSAEKNTDFKQYLNSVIIYLGRVTKLQTILAAAPLGYWSQFEELFKNALNYGKDFVELCKSALPLLGEIELHREDFDKVRQSIEEIKVNFITEETKNLSGHKALFLRLRKGTEEFHASFRNEIWVKYQGAIYQPDQFPNCVATKLSDYSMVTSCLPANWFRATPGEQLEVAEERPIAPQISPAYSNPLVNS